MGGAGLGTATVPIGTASVRSRATTDYGVLGWRGGSGHSKRATILQRRCDVVATHRDDGWWGGFVD